MMSFRAAAADPTVSPIEKKEHAVASSAEELGSILCAALDAEDYAALVLYMAPPSLLGEMGESEDEQRKYASYVETVPALARKLRGFLSEKGLLPLKSMKVENRSGGQMSERTINGKKVQYSTGLLLVGSYQGKVQPLLEIVDQAVVVDGRWYIARLCPESLERQLK